MTVSAKRRAALSELAGLCSELNTLALELSAAPAPAATARERRQRRRPPASTVLTAIGVTLIAGGLAVTARPLIGLLERGRADQSALAQWRQTGSRALAGSAHPAAAARPVVPATGACGGESAADAYALVSFPSLAGDGYSGVAGDGGWDLLHQRSMVHFHGSAAPGAAGNDIIAFHREPNFEHIDRLAVGDTVVVQDRGCRVWNYTVRHRWVLSPDRVTQLGATRDPVLTLVTCDPWFRDTDRIVWQATLSAPQAGAPPART